MRKVLILTLLLMITFYSSAFAATINNQTQEKNVVADPQSILGSNDKDLLPMKRGCCSWHGGVCGCDNGRAVCCDDTYSPTCGCD